MTIFVFLGSLVARSAQLTRQPITSHPSVKSELETLFDYSENSIVVSGKLVTTYVFFLEIHHSSFHAGFSLSLSC